MIRTWLPLDVLAGAGPRRAGWIRAVARGQVTARVDPQSGEWFVWAAARPSELAAALDDPAFPVRFQRARDAAEVLPAVAERLAGGRVTAFPRRAAVRRAA